MRDVIVLSGWSWDTSNVPERLALAFAHLGGRVLYCENPASRLRGAPPAVAEVAQRVYRLRPTILSHRLNGILPISAIQSRLVADQIERATNDLHLANPLVVFPYMARMLNVCRALKRRGFQLVHVCIDHPQPDLREHVTLATQSLVIPRTTFHQLRADFGERIIQLPQIGLSTMETHNAAREAPDPGELAGIAHPRLIYSGTLQSRIHMTLLRAFLEACPNYQFIYFQGGDELTVPNAHALPWLKQDALARVVAACDLGFMPYDCRSEHAFHSVPLKLLDCFALGMPVVSTPIISLWEYSDLVYLGDTVVDLLEAVRRALTEPPESNQRARRRAIARERSVENIAAKLSKDLALTLT